MLAIQRSITTQSMRMRLKQALSLLPSVSEQPYAPTLIHRLFKTVDSSQAQLNSSYCIYECYHNLTVLAWSHTSRKPWATARVHARGLL